VYNPLRNSLVRDTNDLYLLRLIDPWVSVSQNMMDEAVDQWIKRLGLPACERMKGHRLEHLNKNVFILGATIQSHQQSTTENMLRFASFPVNQSISQSISLIATLRLESRIA